MIKEWLLNNNIIKKYSRTPAYARIRGLFPMAPNFILDDRKTMADAEKVLIDWPANMEKPAFGVIQDHGVYPRWTKYCRFLENNDFKYEIYDIQAENWIQTAKKFNVIVGILSNEFSHLQTLRKKFFVLEKYLQRKCYPSFEHIQLYEDKSLETFISKATGIPMVETHFFTRDRDAYNAIESLSYPLVSKTDPGSGSIGVELVRDISQAKRIIKKAFSKKGRATHSMYFRQKDYVYFQELIKNDGYDIRVIMVDNFAFGYFRKVLGGDFRASGMNQVEMRALPEGAMLVARKVYKIFPGPQLVVDMIHGLDGKYYVIEISPFCQMELPEQLIVDEVPGMYIFENDESYYFKPKKIWVHELALREFLKREYLTK